MSFWKKFLGLNLSGDDVKSDEPKLLGEDDYKGFIISAFEMKSGSEFQLFGTIEKEIDGEMKKQSFIRSDRLSSLQEAHNFTLKKGRQIIDEQGEELFNRHC